MEAKYIITDTKEIKLLQDRLKSFSLKSDDRIKLLTSLSVEIVSQTLERFDFQKSPDGDKWAALSQRTRDYYNKKNTGGTLLNRTGQLKDTIDYKVTDSEAIVGATKIYAATHQHGDKSRNIPARSFLGIRADNVGELETIIDRFIEKRAWNKA